VHEHPFVLLSAIEVLLAAIVVHCVAHTVLQTLAFGLPCEQGKVGVLRRGFMTDSWIHASQKYAFTMQGTGFGLIETECEFLRFGQRVATGIFGENLGQSRCGTAQGHGKLFQGHACGLGSGGQGHNRNRARSDLLWMLWREHTHGLAKHGS
jgi:hypothetical protein